MSEEAPAKVYLITFHLYTSHFCVSLVFLLQFYSDWVMSVLTPIKQTRLPSASVQRFLFFFLNKDKLCVQIGWVLRALKARGEQK